MSDSNIISAEKFSLKLRAFVKVLLATVNFPMPFSTKCFATSSIVSPAPITRAWASSKLEKIFDAKLTDAEATDTGFLPIAVSDLTLFAIEKTN